jgi:hypothetical protein
VANPFELFYLVSPAAGNLQISKIEASCGQQLDTDAVQESEAGCISAGLTPDRRAFTRNIHTDALEVPNHSHFRYLSLVAILISTFPLTVICAFQALGFKAIGGFPSAYHRLFGVVSLAFPASKCRLNTVSTMFSL